MSSTSATIDPSTMNSRSVDAIETTRANLCMIMSRCFASPLSMAKEDVERLRKVTPTLPSSMRDTAESLAYEWEMALGDRETLSLAFARLFLGPVEILAPPYASFYLEHDHQLMGPVSQAVAHAYAAAGLEPGEGPREVPDHVSLEWEFLYFLTYRYITTGEKQWKERRHDFLSTHFTLWVPLLGQAIVRAGVHRFYDRLAAQSALSEQFLCAI